MSALIPYIGIGIPLICLVLVFIHVFRTARDCSLPPSTAKPPPPPAPPSVQARQHRVWPSGNVYTPVKKEIKKSYVEPISVSVDNLSNM